MKKKVLIPTKLNTVCRETLEADGRYEVVQDESAGLADLCADHPDAHALIVRSEKVSMRESRRWTACSPPHARRAVTSGSRFRLLRRAHSSSVKPIFIVTCQCATLPSSM